MSISDSTAASMLGEAAAAAERHAEDAALVAAAQEGDARAFEQLLARHEGTVLRLLRLLGVPSHDREDVAQEVFVRVFRHLGRFRRERRFDGWLYRLVVNASHDHHRRAARRRLRETAWDEGADPHPTEGDDPAQSLERSDRRHRLERALELLSERERAVFVLCEMQGEETRTVARALGISSVTVRRHLGRARRRLRSALAEIPGKSPGR